MTLLVLGTMLALIMLAQSQMTRRAERGFDAIGQQAAAAADAWFDEHLAEQRSLAYRAGTLSGPAFGQSFAASHVAFALLLDDQGVIQAIHPPRPDLQVGDALRGRFTHIDQVLDGAALATWVADGTPTDSGRVMATAVRAGSGVLSVAFDPAATGLGPALDVVLSPLPGAVVRLVDPATGLDVLSDDRTVAPDWRTTQTLSRTGLEVQLSAPPLVISSLVDTSGVLPRRLAALLVAVMVLTAWWSLPKVHAARRTAQRRADEAETLFSQSTVPTVVTDLDHRILKVNSALLTATGHDEQDLVGQRAFEVVVDQEEFWRTPPVEVLRPDGAVTFLREVHYHRADHTIGFGRFTATPILAGDGQPVGHMCQLTDLSQVRRTQEALESSREELRLLGHRIAHDLRNPLVAVRELSDMLGRGPAAVPEEMRQEITSHIQRSAGSALELINDLLHRAERMGGEPVTTVELQDVHDWLQRMVGAELAACNGSLDLDSDLARVDVPETALRAVLANLVGNALKYRRDGVAPRVVLHVTASADQTHFVVTDNGAGVAPDMLERIFLPGERGAAAAGVSGSGSGLAEVRRLASLSGGSCWAEPNSPQGLQVHVTLPSAGPDTPTDHVRSGEAADRMVQQSDEAVGTGVTGSSRATSGARRG